MMRLQNLYSTERPDPTPTRLLSHDDLDVARDHFNDTSMRRRQRNGDKTTTSSDAAITDEVKQ